MINLKEDFSDKRLGITYEENVDATANRNGHDLRDFMKANDLKPLNHLRLGGKRFQGGLTFRKRDAWISQLDWALASTAVVKRVEDFRVMNEQPIISTDHAPITLRLMPFNSFDIDILTRATDLGVTVATSSSIPAIRMHSIDGPLFRMNLPPTTDLWLINEANALSEAMSNALYDVAASSRPQPQAAPEDRAMEERWQWLLRCKDSRQVWQAINWGGSIDQPTSSEKPTDSQFCKHYRELLNPSDRLITTFHPPADRYIPILDDDINPGEVLDAIRRLKREKAAGVDGIPPGCLKLLNDEWILLLTFAFNLIFQTQYPSQWGVAKVFNIYKKGDRLLADNYRGISVMAAVSKLYDTILTSRLKLWHNPCIEQAGAQRERGCQEQILTLRLLIDVAIKKKRTLYVAFVDYAKAYDRVDRQKLFGYLDARGCGTRFLRALQASYVMSKGQIGSETFPTCAGVRQGATSSCPLFTMFIEPTIEKVNEFGTDGWLGETHILLLMDDTAVVASSRDALTKKLEALLTSAAEIGMTVNSSKSKYLHVNERDTAPFQIGDVVIEYSPQYTYLGTPISATNIRKQVQEHIQSKAAHVNKFSAFLRKNSDAPFAIKMQVWKCALQSALFYSCETWLCNDLKAAEKVYSFCIKQLLGIRQTTCTDVAFIEAGVPGAVAEIRHRQQKFLKKLRARPEYGTSYLSNVITLAVEARSPSGILLSQLLESNTTDFVREGIDSIKARIEASSSSKRRTYLTINPALAVHCVYTSSPSPPEAYRVCFTRLRTSSHSLRIETGRWARIPVDERLCPCGDVQTEEHVFLTCPLLATARPSHCATLFDIFQLDTITLCKFCHQIAAMF